MAGVGAVGVFVLVVHSRECVSVDHIHITRSRIVVFLPKRNRSHIHTQLMFLVLYSIILNSQCAPDKNSRLVLS